MAVSRPDVSHDDSTERELAHTASLHAADAPTEQLLTGPLGDQCANCGAVMAADQRYCLTCGERRGRSRFAAGSAPAPGGSVTTTTVTTTAPPPTRRSSAGMTLIAGIATLILAMGVGVLIGQRNNSSGTPARAPQVIVNGGGSGGSGSTAAAANNPSTSASGKHPKVVKVLKTEKARAANAAKAAKPTAAAVQKAGNAAAKVTGGSNTQKPTVKSGDACAAGSPGCTNGHFTGTFFGP